MAARQAAGDVEASSRGSSGIGFVVEDTVAAHLAERRLVNLLDPWSHAFPDLFLCYPQQRQMPPALRALIDAVRGHAAS